MLDKKQMSIFAQTEAALLHTSPENIREHGLFVANDGKEMTISCPDSEGYIELVDLDPLNKDDTFAIDALSDFIAYSIPTKSAAVVKATRRKITFKMKDVVEGEGFIKPTDDVAFNNAIVMLGVAYNIRVRDEAERAARITSAIRLLQEIRDNKPEPAQAPKECAYCGKVLENPEDDFCDQGCKRMWKDSAPPY